MQQALIEPPKERIEFLLDLLRKNKPQVILYLTAQESPNKATSSHDARVNIQTMKLSDFEQAGFILKIWSDVLNEMIYFVSSDAVINNNPLNAVGYSTRELEAMLDMTPAEVLAAHTVKTLFHKAKVIKHTVSHGQL